MEWISVKDNFPPKDGRDKLIWFYSTKSKTVKLGYGSQYGYYDLEGNGLAFSYWKYLELPEPPKQ